MKIALVQFDAVPEDVAGNLAKMTSWVRKATAQNANVVMFHEASLTDFVSDVSLFAQTVPAGEACQTMKQLAEEQKIIISFGLLEKAGDQYYITQVFFGPDHFYHKYRKTNLHEPNDPQKAAKRFRDETSYFAPGMGPKIFELGGHRVACMICADGNNNELLDNIRRMKPDFVLYPNNRTRPWSDEYWQAIVTKIGAPLLITNRVGESWGYSSRGGVAVYNSHGILIKRANLDGREEMMIVDTQEFI